MRKTYAHPYLKMATIKHVTILAGSGVNYAGSNNGSDKPHSAESKCDFGFEEDMSGDE